MVPILDHIYVWFANIFCNSAGSFFTFSVKSFEIQSMKHKRFFPMFSPGSFIVSVLIVWSLIYFQLNFIHNVREGSNFSYSFACRCSLDPTSFAEKTVISLCNDLGILAKNRLAIDVWIYFQALNSFPLLYMSTLCQYHTVLIIVAL